MSLNSHSAASRHSLARPNRRIPVSNQPRAVGHPAALFPTLATDFAATPGACALSACPIGSSAVVLAVRCPAGDACRLRALGIYEGACVAVVGTRPGMMIEVRGTRLVLGASLAATVGVMPLDAA